MAEETKKRRGPQKTKPTQRSARSIPAVLDSNLIYSAPLLSLANRLRQRAAEIRRYRRSDELAEALDAIAAEIADAVQAGKENEWLDTHAVRLLTGLSLDTIRRHCESGKIAPAKKTGGVWRVHRTAVELYTTDEERAA
jgi:hypothetical protein